MSTPSAEDRNPHRYTASLLSRTDSTVSGIPGPGRLVGDFLHHAGRRIEPALSRAAERLGFGPTPLVRRLLILIVERHKKKKNCALLEKFSIMSVERVLDTSHYPCRICRGGFDCSIDDDIRPASRDNLVKLLQFLRYEFSALGACKFIG